MIIEEILDGSNIQDVLKALSKNEIEKVLKIIKSKFPKNTQNFLKKIFAPTFEPVDEMKNMPLSLKVLYEILNSEMNFHTLYEKHTPQYSIDVLSETRELIRCIYVLENLENREKETLVLAKYLLHFLRESAEYITQNSNNYPENSISASIWMFGAGIRIQADEMAEYFKKYKDDYREMSAKYYKLQVTNGIMNHYPHFVGPDMIALAEKYEDLGTPDEALKGYLAVIADFEYFLEEIEYHQKEDEGFELTAEQEMTLKSLIKACENAKRLGKNIDSSLIQRSQKFLK